MGTESFMRLNNDRLSADDNARMQPCELRTTSTTVTMTMTMTSRSVGDTVTWEQKPEEGVNRRNEPQPRRKQEDQTVRVSTISGQFNFYK